LETQVDESRIPTAAGRNAPSQVQARATTCCCGATDHVKVSFGGCRLNKKNLPNSNNAGVPGVAAMVVAATGRVVLQNI